MKIKQLIKSKCPDLFEYARRKKLVFMYHINPKIPIERIMGKIDWENPRTLNEKLQCLKIGEYFNNPVITTCCDKVLVKDYIKNVCGDCCKVAKNYGVYDDPDQIKWDELPRSFVIKCNHGCGYNIICDDKNSLDIKETSAILKKWLKEDYWTIFYEPQYRHIKRKILIEENLGDSIDTYKFYCFNGVPKIMYISNKDENGEIDKYLDYFNMDFEWQNITLKGHLNMGDKVKKPACWEELKDISRKLSKDFPFVRVDLYEIDGEIYLSELTFLPTGGYMNLNNPDILLEWGEWLKL